MWSEILICSKVFSFIFVTLPETHHTNSFLQAGSWNSPFSGGSWDYGDNGDNYSNFQNRDSDDDEDCEHQEDADHALHAAGNVLGNLVCFVLYKSMISHSRIKMILVQSLARLKTLIRICRKS